MLAYYLKMLIALVKYIFCRCRIGVRYPEGEETEQSEAQEGNLCLNASEFLPRHHQTKER
jgi:hypothetical protein